MNAPAQPKPQPPADADLLVRYREGDPDAFREIVGSFEDKVVQFFFRLCWDRDRAEDFAQEVFLRLMRGSQRYRPEGRLSTFIYRIATNLWIDHYRSQRPQPRLYSLDQAVVKSDWQPRQSRERSPSEAAIADEQRAALRRGLESLTEPHRIVFELAVYQERPYAEIGELLGIPVGTVKSRMHNSVQALKKLLAEERGAGADSFRVGSAGVGSAGIGSAGIGGAG